MLGRTTLLNIGVANWIECKRLHTPKVSLPMALGIAVPGTEYCLEKAKASCEWAKWNFKTKNTTARHKATARKTRPWLCEGIPERVQTLKYPVTVWESSPVIKVDVDDRLFNRDRPLNNSCTVCPVRKYGIQPIYNQEAISEHTFAPRPLRTRLTHEDNFFSIDNKSYLVWGNSPPKMN